ncbi:MAG: DUF104 domain-containing protein [Planctomycetaceae bacterium]
MIQRVKATFKDGAFVPDEDCDLPEDARVQLTVESESSIPATVTDPEQRQAILDEVVELMKSNPIPESAPRFTREELHERR